MAIVISDALQIQLWINGALTFNETEPPYPIFKKCFYQEFSIYDNVYVQFKDAPGLDYHVEFYDEDNALVLTVPMVEIVAGVYEYGFTGVGLGFVDMARKIKIQQGVVIGTVTTEEQLSIEEFVADMDGWVNETHRPDATLQDLDDFDQRDVSSPLPATNWAAQPSGPMVGKPYRNFPTFYTTPSYTRVCFIEFDGLNAYSYNLNIKLDVAQNIAFTINFSAAIIFYDSSFNVLGNTGFVENNFAPGIKSFDFTVPAGIGNVAYIGLRIFDDSVHTSMTSLVITWFEATVYNPAYTNWAFSADNGGSLKLTTAVTTDKSVMFKTPITLPQEAHFIRVKWDISYPTLNTGLTLFFKIKQGNTVLDSIVLDVPIDGTEQTFIIPVTNPLVWVAADTLSFEILDSDNTFVAADIIHINSIEFYKEVIETITAFTERAKSDFVRFLINPIDSFPLYYKSVKNFAGLYYNSMSPYRVIRIPGLFFKERKATEQMSLSISNGKEVGTASMVKFQKLMLVDDVPDYMHTKIIEALQHHVSGSVVANNVEWVWQAGDNYEEVESNPEYIFTNGKIYLTRKSKTIRNVI